MLTSDKTSQPCRRDGVCSREGDQGSVTALQWPSCPGSPGGLCSRQRLAWAPALTGLFACSPLHDLQHHWGRMGKRRQLIPTAPEVQLVPSECSQPAPLEVVHALAAAQWPTGYLQGRNLRVWAQFNQSCLVVYCETAFSERRYAATASFRVSSEFPSTWIIFSGMARNVLCEKEKWR